MVEVVVEGPGKNALGSELMERLAGEIAGANGAPLLIRGEGDAFSAGLNLAEVASLELDQMESFLRRLEGLMEAVFRYPGPTVAAVNGHAIAGGCLLAMMCDHRVGTTSERARIGLNEVALGLRFPPRLLAMAMHRMQPGPASERVLLAAELHTPQMALSLGLLDELADDPVEVAKKRLAARVAPDGAYEAAKHVLRGHVGRIDADVERVFLEDVLPVWAGEPLKRRIAGFLNRKK